LNEKWIEYSGIAFCLMEKRAILFKTDFRCPEAFQAMMK